MNDSIIQRTDKKPIKLNLENTELSENIKGKVHKEFEEISKLLDFSNKSYEIFRRWYVDGRLFFHIIVDKKIQNLVLKN